MCLFFFRKLFVTCIFIYLYFYIFYIVCIIFGVPSPHLFFNVFFLFSYSVCILSVAHIPYVLRYCHLMQKLVCHLRSKVKFSLSKLQHAAAQCFKSRSVESELLKQDEWLHCEVSLHTWQAISAFPGNFTL